MINYFIFLIKLLPIAAIITLIPALFFTLL